MEILSYIKAKGMKPLILTNGFKISQEPSIIKELKKAGAFGFTLHVDSEQERPHWQGKTEHDLLDLRLEYARRIKEAGGLHCSVGATVYPGTIDSVPEIVRWPTNISI
jgi:uncharacterized radical SAM superfamily Fe-S cluster-containing enzyme